MSQRPAEQLDRQNCIIKVAITKLKDTKIFQDKGAGSVGVRTEEEVKGGGTEKTEKQRECCFYPPPLQVSVQAPSSTLLERASEGGGALSAAHPML